MSLAALIITHLYAVSSRQRSYDWLRCEEESGKMGKSTLIDLINQVQDIKNCFTTSYQTVVSYPDRPPKQKQYQTIRANKEYALWRARIEAELGMLTQDKTVDDIYKLFSFIEKGYSESYYFTQLEAKLTVLEELLLSGRISRLEDGIKGE